MIDYINKNNIVAWDLYYIYIYISVNVKYMSTIVQKSGEANGRVQEYYTVHNTVGKVV